MKAYLDFMKGLFFLVAITLIVGAGLIVDGDGFDLAVKMLITGIISMAGVLMCQALKKLR